MGDTFGRYTIDVVAGAGECCVSVLWEGREYQRGGERKGEVSGFVVVRDGRGEGGGW